MPAAQTNRRKASRKLVKTRHPGIFKRGSSYVVIWYDNDGKQRKESKPSLTLAMEFQGQRRARGMARIASPQDRFEDYAPRWLESYVGRTSRGISEATRDAYRRALDNRVIPFFRGMRLQDVTPPHVRAFVKGMEDEGLRAATIRKDGLAPLAAMLADAVEDGLIQTNPTASVKVIDRPDAPKTMRGFTVDQLHRFMAEVPETWRVFFFFMVATGVRISEATGLRWGDVTFGEHPYITIRSTVHRGTRRGVKSAASERRVSLPPNVAQPLWRDHHGKDPGAPVFPSAVGTPLRADNLRNRVFRPAAERAGVYRKGLGFHDLRHACASFVWARYRDDQVVQTWLGHADSGFTRRTYIHPIESGPASADFFDAVLTPEGGNEGATSDPRPATTSDDRRAALAAV